MIYFSVIIPVYNGEKYLEKAINSIVNQPVKELEIIIVDDGSIDGTSELCDRYVATYKNIHVIHQKNQGVSAARNKGIECARGKYVLFLDSDDTFVENAINYNMVKECQKGYDVILYSSLITNVDRNRYGPDIIMRDSVFPGKRALPTSGHLGSGLYRKDILIKNHVYFDEGIRLNEDFAFKMKAMYAARIIKTTSSFLYIYSTTPGSTRYTEKNYYDFVAAWEKVLDWLNGYKDDENILQTRIFVQTKILSRLLLYSKLFVQQGHNKKELYNELCRLNAWDKLKTMPVDLMIPGQKKDLLRFQKSLDTFVYAAKLEGYKITIGRILLRNRAIRYIRDLKRMPWKKIEEIRIQ